MKLSGLTNIGLQRVQNEDAFLIKQINDYTYFLLVCDGMGGANAGGLASQFASEYIYSYIKEHYNEDNFNNNLLVDAINYTNKNIFNHANMIDEHKGMGTTAVLAFIRKNELTIAHVGDSRAYIIKKDNIMALTTDHSIVQTLLDEGKISEEQAKNHPQKNVITRAIGVSSFVEVDVKNFILDDDDILILCTDGLSGFLEEKEILNIVNQNKFNLCAQALIDKANELGGADNITVIIASKNKS